MSAMSAADVENVQSMEGYLRGVYSEMKEADQQLHRFMRIAAERIAGLDFAHDPDVIQDIRMLASGKIDLSEAIDAHSFAAEVRARSTV